MDHEKDWIKWRNKGEVYLEDHKNKPLAVNNLWKLRDYSFQKHER
jgi:hypothetical protein